MLEAVFLFFSIVWFLKEKKKKKDFSSFFFHQEKLLRPFAPFAEASSTQDSKVKTILSKDWVAWPGLTATEKKNVFFFPLTGVQLTFKRTKKTQFLGTSTPSQQKEKKAEKEISLSFFFLRMNMLATLKQACSQDSLGAQVAFKDSMIHWILQFTLRIAFCCVLHRCTSQEIHR